MMMGAIWYCPSLKFPETPNVLLHDGLFECLLVSLFNVRIYSGFRFLTVRWLVELVQFTFSARSLLLKALIVVLVSAHYQAYIQTFSAVPVAGVQAILALRFKFLRYVI